MTNPLVTDARGRAVAFDGVCAALQAVADGRIRRLGICQPPGTAKSVLGAVAFPAYLQLASGGTERVMCGSFSHSFALRDATRCRDLMQSDAYRELVAGEFAIRRFPDRVDDFWLTNGGRRMIVSPGGATMGERCTVQVIDDALSSNQAYSESAKREARRWVSTALTSRLEDQERNRRVMIMQRLATDDPMAWAIERGWKILDLTAILGRDANLQPVEEAPCELYDDAGALVWRDERKPGDTVSPLLTERALKELREDMGAAAFAAQYLQKPQDAGAAIFHRAWFGRSDPLPRCDREVIALDASFKEGDDSDFAVIQAWGASGDDRYLLEQWRRRAGFVDTLAAMRDVRARHPSARVLVEAAANGHAIIDQLGRELGAGVVEAVPATGGKMPRWQAVAPICERGKVVAQSCARWDGDGGLDAWLGEVCAAPNGDHDDQVDAMAYALVALDERGSEWPDYSQLRRQRFR